jgi:hypothetical protein
MLTTDFKVGDEIHLTITGVTNDRVYSSCGEITEIRGGYIATVRYKQPWAPAHNCMRWTLVDLRTAKKLTRRPRKPHNTDLRGSSDAFAPRIGSGSPTQRRE